ASRSRSQALANLLASRRRDGRGIGRLELASDAAFEALVNQTPQRCEELVALLGGQGQVVRVGTDQGGSHRRRTSASGARSGARRVRPSAGARRGWRSL